MITSTYFFRQSFFSPEPKEHDLTVFPKDHLAPWGLHEENPVQAATRFHLPQRLLKIKSISQTAKTDLCSEPKNQLTSNLFPSNGSKSAAQVEPPPPSPQLLPALQAKKSLTTLQHASFRSERYNGNRSYESISINQFIRQQRNNFTQRTKAENYERMAVNKGEDSNFLVSRNAKKALRKQTHSTPVKMRKQDMNPHLDRHQINQRLPIVFAINSVKPTGDRQEALKYRPIRQYRYHV